MIAILYADARGPYPKMAERLAIGAYSYGEISDQFGRGAGADFRLDVYALPRDARAYAGPHSVVAHPPCGPWGKLRHLYKQDEHDCGPRAVEQVRAFGGVLEHPSGSRLWGGPSCLNARGALPGAVVDLPFMAGTDAWGGYTISVDQCMWGHVARKQTWLYLVGVPRSALEAPPFPDAEPTHWASGSRTAKRGPVPPGIKVCSAEQRRRTPPLFAAYLIRLARAAQNARP